MTRTPMRSRVRDTRPVAQERGSASPVIVAVIAVVMVCAVALAQVGAGLAATARASGAADLAALAAAREDRDLRALGERSPLRRACRVAAHVSRINGATLTECSRGAGSSIVVSVSVQIPGWPTLAAARSRAGPAGG